MRSRDSNDRNSSREMSLGGMGRGLRVEGEEGKMEGQEREEGREGQGGKE